jgi:hypothetical protein
MTTPMSASDTLAREFLGIRSRLLDVAAALDRVDRAAGAVGDDPRAAKLREALELLVAGGAERAERLQLLFSLPYQEQWRRQFGV